MVGTVISEHEDRFITLHLKQFIGVVFYTKLLGVMFKLNIFTDELMNL